MKHLLILPLLLLAAACSTPLGGSGQMTDGTPVVAQRTIHTGEIEDFRITSPDGWTCEGSINYVKQIAVANTTTTTFPLKCSNGVTGSAVVSYPSTDRSYIMKGAINLAFTLSNGKKGAVSI
jgi:hypothetical protein